MTTHSHSDRDADHRAGAFRSNETNQAGALDCEARRWQEDCRLVVGCWDHHVPDFRCNTATLTAECELNCIGHHAWRGSHCRHRFGNKQALAMVTYLRPASSAMATASGRERLWRAFANLTSMGRLTPPSTSTLGRLMQEIARSEGVPPNMSVRMATPSPLSTRLTASMMSLRQRAESSSAQTVMASICFCGPITCSSAALNSSARRPWVTSTRPIIGNSSRVLFGAPHERATLTIQRPRARGHLGYCSSTWR